MAKKQFWDLATLPHGSSHQEGEGCCKSNLFYEIIQLTLKGTVAQGFCPLLFSIN
jgi:hypothetical protein